MYSIGEFSRINRVTPKTLRHYEKIGLIFPAETDDWTGYRYYSPQQLPLMQKILYLREMGFSLTEIKDLLENQLGLETLLAERQKELKAAIKAEKRRLDQVTGYLETLKGVKTMNEKITIKPLPTVTAAAMRTTVESYDTYFDIVPNMGEYMKSVGAVCSEPAYCFTIYHDGEYREHDFDVEICEAVVAPCAESDKVKFKEIPGYDEAACLYHKGGYDTLGRSYNALFTWAEERGYQAAGKPRESYIDGIWNKESQEDWLTEIQLPIRRLNPGEA